MIGEIKIDILPTPNPNALKFITGLDLILGGKVSFSNPTQTEGVELAEKLFELRGVDQIHFFQNVVTVSKFSFEPWDSLEPQVQSVIKEYLPRHNPDFKIVTEEDKRREELPADLLEIEKILDKKIRPGLQGDGGDLECISYQDDVLLVKYQGACGTCPSSTMGTLEAIRQILRDEFSPDIEVYVAPEY